MLSEDTASTHRFSVLLVEDDPAVANLVMSALGIEGYLVTGCVASLDDAIQAVEAQQPDLIMLGREMISLEEFSSRRRSRVTPGTS